MVRFKVRFVLFSINNVSGIINESEKDIVSSIKSDIIHCFGEYGASIVFPSLISIYQ